MNILLDNNIDTKRLETATIQYNSVVMTIINKIYFNFLIVCIAVLFDATP